MHVLCGHGEMKCKVHFAELNRERGILESVAGWSPPVVVNLLVLAVF